MNISPTAPRSARPPRGALIVAVQELLAEKEPDVVMVNLRVTVTDHLHRRLLLVDMADFLAVMSRAPEARRALDAITSRMWYRGLR